MLNSFMQQLSKPNGGEDSNYFSIKNARISFGVSLIERYPPVTQKKHIIWRDMTDPAHEHRTRLVQKQTSITPDTMHNLPREIRKKSTIIKGDSRVGPCTEYWY